MTDSVASDTQSTDEFLVIRVAQQDVTAFTVLYDRYARVVYVMAIHLLGSYEGEEAVQEIFLRLWHTAAQFDPARGIFRSWFLTLARNYLLDQLRRRNVEQQQTALQDIEQVLENRADPAAGVAEAAFARQRAYAVYQALAQLPPEQRRTVVLSYFGGLSQADIARRLGWPVGTVKKRMRLALQKLRRSLIHWNELTR